MSYIVIGKDFSRQSIEQSVFTHVYANLWEQKKLFTWEKRSTSHMIGLEHQHGRPFRCLEHRYGRRDSISKFIMADNPSLLSGRFLIQLTSKAFHKTPKTILVAQSLRAEILF